MDLIGRTVRNDPVRSGHVLALANHVRRRHARSDLAEHWNLPAEDIVAGRTRPVADVVERLRAKIGQARVPAGA